jgi:hypothetical protein
MSDILLFAEPFHKYLEFEVESIYAGAEEKFARKY